MHGEIIEKLNSQLKPSIFFENPYPNHLVKDLISRVIICKSSAIFEFWKFAFHAALYLATLLLKHVMLKHPTKSLLPFLDFARKACHSIWYLFQIPSRVKIICQSLMGLPSVMKSESLLVRTYVFHLLRPYVMILYNWLILWQNVLYLYLGRFRMF